MVCFPLCKNCNQHQNHTILTCHKQYQTHDGADKRVQIRHSLTISTVSLCILLTSFHKSWKLTKNIITALPAQSLHLNVTENVCLAIKLKLHIETDVIKMRAELVKAECRNRRSLFIEYIQNLYASIPHKLHSVIAGKYFSTKYWRFEAILIRFCVVKYVFCCRLLPYVLYPATILATHFRPHTVVSNRSTDSNLLAVIGQSM